MIQSLLSLANSDGVIVIDSGKPGPTLGIVAITHGNEPVGLKVFEYLIDTYDIQSQLDNGRVYLIINNIDAYLENKRFLVRDMNRIWSESGVGSEYTRMSTLTPYLAQCDHILDLHSTSSPSVPMVIDAGNLTDQNSLLSELDVDYTIRGIMPYMSGETLVAYHERIHPGSQSIVIECGAHTEEGTHIRAIENTLRFLSYFGVLIYSYNKKSETIILAIRECIHARDAGEVEYFYTKSPRSFDIISANTHVARCAGLDIYSPNYESYIIMPTPSAFYKGEEIMYFAERIYL